jgi:spermidine/putrescine transport system substrate-binding protein
MPSKYSRNSRLYAGSMLHSENASFLMGSTRRRFLQLSTAALSGAVLSNCARNLADPGGAETSSASSGSTADAKILRLYSWTNYTDDELLASFKAKTGIEAIVDTYDSNETMLAKMQAGGGSAYSIIFPSDYMVTQMVELDMLTPLDKTRLKGLENLWDKWQSPVYDPDNAHSVPATWGTTGMLYDPKRLGGELKGWDYLFDKKGQLTRKVTLLDDVREVMGSVLRYLGYSYNTENVDEIKQAYDQLVSLKPTVANFITNGWEDQLASGDLQISMAYSADAIALIADNPNLQYVVPETGSSIWTDTMVIPKSAPNVDAAYEWLNFMLEPDNAAQTVERLKFATPNKAAFEQLADELKQDQDLFPPDDVVDKCEGIAPLSQKTTEEFDKYWTQLTSA